MSRPKARALLSRVIIGLHRKSDERHQSRARAAYGGVRPLTPSRDPARLSDWDEEPGWTASGPIARRRSCAELVLPPGVIFDETPDDVALANWRRLEWSHDEALESERRPQRRGIISIEDALALLPPLAEAWVEWHSERLILRMKRLEQGLGGLPDAWASAVAGFKESFQLRFPTAGARHRKRGRLERTVALLVPFEVSPGSSESGRRSTVADVREMVASLGEEEIDRLYGMGVVDLRGWRLDERVQEALAEALSSWRIVDFDAQRLIRHLAAANRTAAAAGAHGQGLRH